MKSCEVSWHDIIGDHILMMYMMLLLTLLVNLVPHVTFRISNFHLLVFLVGIPFYLFIPNNLPLYCPSPLRHVQSYGLDH